MGVENLKLRKIYEKVPEDYEERLSNASRIMACWLVRLYIKRKGDHQRVRKNLKKALTKNENYVKLWFQENNCFLGQGSWKRGTRQAK